MRRHSFSVIVLLALITAAPASAQYMYLDSNGDGIHTAADVLNAVGTNQVEIWLRTAHNQDGSTVVCRQEPSQMTINSYTFILKAANGTVSWSNAANLMPSFGIALPSFSDETLFSFARAGAGSLSPGDYRLARVTITVASGTPAVDIVPSDPALVRPYENMTSFGCSCSGIDFDNTLRLGSDWFDVDGLSFSGGGSTNVPPSIEAITDMTVPVGEPMSADISIQDSDGDILTAAISPATPFVRVTELGSSLGSLTARIQVWPRRGHEGSYNLNLVAGDGTQEASRPFHVTVVPAPNHAPSAAAHGSVDVASGTVVNVRLSATDADGDGTIFSKLSGPAFAEVRTADPGRGGGAGYLTLRPTLCDVGSSEVVAGVSDGYTTTNITVPIRVLANAVSAGSSVPGTVSLWALDVGDFNEDGHVDAVAVGERQSGMTIFLGDGTGGMSPTPTQLAGTSSVAVAVGDWNGDRHRDIAVGSLDLEGLQILYGRGDGSFASPVLLPEVARTTNMRSADLNRDGTDDLVVVGHFNHVDALLGLAPTGLRPAFRLPTASLIQDIAIEDFDRDGTRDLAMTTLEGLDVGMRVLLGRGDGTFGDSRVIHNVRVFATTSGDWNLDGKVDLAASQFDTRAFSALGFGDGTFSYSLLADDLLITQDIATADWNGDGKQDLILATDGPARWYIGNGDGTFGFSTLPILSLSGIAIADLNEDGRPDLVGVSGGTSLRILLNTTTTPAGVAARAFVDDKGKNIAITSSSRTLCARLEPMAGTFRALDVDLASIRLTSEGTGSVSSISAVAAKQAVVGDTDRNEIEECPACFAMSDLARLFDGLHGKQTVSVRVEGSLLDGSRFCAPMAMSIVAGGGGALAARVEPNPMNPRGVLRFSIERSGPVTVRLFDVNGRLVRTLWNRRQSLPGPQEAAIDGVDAANRPMATGVYFFRIDERGASTTGRFTVLK